MEFRKVLALRGPNIWAYFPVIEAWVDLQDLKEAASDQLPGLNERLMAWLPTLIEHRCSVGERGGFFERLRRGTYPAHILEHLTIELQNLAGTPVGYGRARETSEEGVYKVVVEYKDENLARAALEAARELYLAAVRDLPFDVAGTVERLQGLARAAALPPGTGALIRAAKARRIPALRLADEVTLQLGHGVHQTRVPLRPDQALPEGVLDQWFPEGRTGRVPVVGITGVNGKTTTTRLIAHVLTRWGRRVGMTCTEGIYVGRERIETGDCSGPKSTRAVLQDPRVEAAVLEIARGGILREGLGFDECDVGVVTNIGEGDHLGINGVETPEQLARVKRTLVDCVARTGAAVLKADDPLTAEMAGHCPGSVIFFACAEGQPVLAEHRRTGGKVAFVRNGHIILAEGDRETDLVPLKAVPLTHGGVIRFQVENTLAAAAAAHALGVPPEVIRAGLETFNGSMDSTPARFNLLAVNNATVVMDYGHNVSSLRSLVEALDQFPHRRRSVVYTAAGDRRDEDMIRQGEILGQAFDRVILYEDDGSMRGRQAGEIIRLFRRGIAAGRRASEVLEIDGALAAAEFAMMTASHGELILLQVDPVDDTIDLVRQLLASGLNGREIDFAEAVRLTRLEGAMA